MFPAGVDWHGTCSGQGMSKLTYLETLTALGPVMERQSDVFVGHSVEYPGTLELLTDGGGAWVIGTANGCWGADLYVDYDALQNGEQPDHAIDTHIAPKCTDVNVIADALYAAMLAIGSKQ
jgi:hypothetical protein